MASPDPQTFADLMPRDAPAAQAGPYTVTAAGALVEKLVANPTKKRRIRFAVGQDEAPGQVEATTGAPVKDEPAKRGGRPLRGLEKSIATVMNRNEVARLAFEVDPAVRSFQSIYRAKPRGCPDWLIKRMQVQDDLVAAITLARSNQVAAHGRPRRDRHGIGFILEPKVGTVDELDAQQKAALDERIEKLEHKLWNCGSTLGLRESDKMTLSTFLLQVTRDAVGPGKIAVEMIHDDNDQFLRFRPIDAGTIAPAVPMMQSGATIRAQAISLLDRLNGREEDKSKHIDVKRFLEDEYDWVQVIDTTPRQVFTAKQCVVHNFYPVTDVEMDGWPVPPIDNVVSAVTTHINITTHNKMYFQSGRAARGMLVITSEDVDDDVLKEMQQHFEASINSSKNAWRLPIIGLGKGDTCVWQPMEMQGARDAEFQYLTDANARTILSIFAMAPEELPGWAYLSHGTNSKALGESNNQYILEASRDLGIRPLIASFEDFFNQVILPKLDPELAKEVRFSMVGMDSESREEEATQIATDMPLHMTYNDVMRKTEKKPLPRELGGDVPLNPQFHALVLDKFVKQGVIVETLLGVKGASKDRTLDFVNNPNWIAWQQFLAQQDLQAQQMQLQSQQAQAQAAQGGQQAAGGAGAPQAPAEASGVSDPGAPSDQGGQPAQGYDTRTENQKNAASKGADLERSLTATIDDLGKSEAMLSPAQRRMLKLHKAAVDDFVHGFAQDAEKVKHTILASVDELMG
jgi:hypothetical protein